MVVLERNNEWSTSSDEKQTWRRLAVLHDPIIAPAFGRGKGPVQSSGHVLSWFSGSATRTGAPTPILRNVGATFRCVGGAVASVCYRRSFLDAVGNTSRSELLVGTAFLLQAGGTALNAAPGRSHNDGCDTIAVSRFFPVVSHTDHGNDHKSLPRGFASCGRGLAQDAYDRLSPS